MKTGSFPKIGVMPAAPQYPLLNPRSDDEQMVCASPISRARNGCRAGYHFFGQPISKCCFSLPRAVISERKLCDCTVDLRAYLVRLFWKDQQQQPYAGFDHLPRKVEDGPIVFAMNAGMYEEDLSPVGLYVENGKTLRPANRKSGSGNFYLKPNGVLFITGQDAGIATTDRFVAERRRVDFATQSGPMLVITW